MKQTYLIFFLFFSLIINSQTSFNIHNFTVTRGDLETNIYEKDSTANAIEIHEYGNTYVDNHNFDLILEEKHKIKILNKKGFKHATVILYIPKYNDKRRYELVEDIFGTTYNLENGKTVKTKLLQKNIFREEYSDDYTLVKFTLPNVKPGSVITYSYKYVSSTMLNYRGWNFQGEIPKLYSEYTTSIPENIDYNVQLIGSKKLFSHTADIEINCLDIGKSRMPDCSKFVYTMKDVPAFIKEDYMTSWKNYLSRIDYRLKTFIDFKGQATHYTKTWKNVDRELKDNENIGAQILKSINEKELLSTEIINETNTLKKATEIYKYIQNNYIWNGEHDIFDNVSVKELIKNKSGNVSSINILLLNLLNACEIDAKPVLLSTRSNGFATKIFPVIYDFNYLITQVTIDNKTYNLDATDKYLGFGELPFKCLNKYGRLLDFKKGSEWVDIYPSKTTSENYMVTLNFDENENLVGHLKSKSTGYASLEKRKNYSKNSEAYLENIQNRNPNIEISNHEVVDFNKNGLNFSENFDIKYNSKGTDHIYLNPFFVKFFKTNPFKLQERTYPIDFGFKKTFLYMANIDIGSDYEIIEKPQDVIYTLPNKKGLLAFSTKIIDNKINLSLRVDFKSSIYEPEYYPYLKDYINKLIDIQKNSLILLKKK